MSCEQIRGLLPLFAGQDLAEPRRGEVMAHLEGCGACRGELESFEGCRRLLEGLRGERQLSRREVRRIWKAVSAELPRPEPSVRRIRMLAAVRYAAALLIGMSASFTVTTLLSGPPREAPPGARVEPQPAPAVPEADVRAIPATDGGEAALPATLRSYQVGGDRIIISGAGRTQLVPLGQPEILRLNQEVMQLKTRIWQLEQELRKLKGE